MKRIAAIFLTLIILTSCSVTKSTEDESKLNIITTIFAPYDFARQVAGEHGNVKMLLPPASESHSFEPTPKDIIAIQNCDIFIYVGGENDKWVDDVLSSMDTSKMKIIKLLEVVKPVEEVIKEGMQEHEEHNDEEHNDAEHNDEEHNGEEHNENDDDHDADHAEIELDEHVWTSPKNAEKIVQYICDTAVEIDSANAQSYIENAKNYNASIEEIDAEFENIMKTAARKTVVFGDRFPFRYMADEFGIEYFAAFPGCSTETDASAATLAFLIDKVKAEDIPVVFHIELSNAKIANAISEATGAKVLLLHACHNISKEDFENGVTYVDLMRQNAKNLKEALS